MNNTYRRDIDCMKGIAIIAVVLFHLGLMKSGYLGVDVFFVISGFLAVPAVFSGLLSGTFSYSVFLEKRVLRLLPLIVISSALSLALGLVGMLPDSLENLSESVVASNLMSENILEAVTTRNYWDVGNDFKPLMHMWYIGVLFEFYVIFPLILVISKRLGRVLDREASSCMLIALLVSALVSLLLYLLPAGTAGNKFYFIQYRFFELAIGGISGLAYASNGRMCRSKGTQWAWIILLAIVVFSSLFKFSSVDSTLPVGAKEDMIDTGLILPKQVLLLMSVMGTGIFVLRGNGAVRCSFLEYLGKRSYSIFIWHQVLLAFYRYFFTTKISLMFVMSFFIVVLALSEISYRFVEKKVKPGRRNLLAWIAAAILIIVPSLYIYSKAGVVHDVPELDVTADGAHRGMHSEYCDRIYGFDKDFPENSTKLNVLVVGKSFARDMGNVILESEYADSVNLSYGYQWDPGLIDRVRRADVVFSFSARHEVPDYVWSNLGDGVAVWGVGTKSFGESYGSIFLHRREDNYFDTTVTIDENYLKLNELWASEWGSYYIDFISIATVSPGMVRVFTPDCHFISHDTIHLERAGAKWYASVIDWSSIFDKR